MPTIAVVGEVVADAVLPPDGIVDGAAARVDRQVGGTVDQYAVLPSVYPTVTFGTVTFGSSGGGTPTQRQRRQAASSGAGEAA